MGTLGQNVQIGVRGLICVSLGVLDVKKFENHWATLWPILASHLIISTMQANVHHTLPQNFKYICQGKNFVLSQTHTW